MKRHSRVIFASLACAVLAACATQEVLGPPTAFRMTSPAFADNAMLAQRNAGNLKTNRNCLGENVSPPLQWSNASQHYVFTLIATDLEPAALKPGMTMDEVLKALQGGKAPRAASLAFRYAH